MCHSMMGLTRCYKTAVFFTFDHYIIDSRTLIFGVRCACL